MTTQEEGSSAQGSADGPGPLQAYRPRGCRGSGRRGRAGWLQAQTHTLLSLGFKTDMWPILIGFNNKQAKNHAGEGEAQQNAKCPEQARRPSHSACPAHRKGPSRREQQQRFQARAGSGAPPRALRTPTLLVPDPPSDLASKGAMRTPAV